MTEFTLVGLDHEDSDIEIVSDEKTTLDLSKRVIIEYYFNYNEHVLFFQFKSLINFFFFGSATQH